MRPMREKMHTGELYLPSNVVAVGNPCKILRKIDEAEIRRLKETEK